MFKGSIVALVTPFKNGAVDKDAFARLVEWHIAEGTHGLVPCGTTGESPTLSAEEHMSVVAHCVEVTAGRIPVIAGTGSNNTAEALEFTQHAKDVGADGALIVTPYYNKPTQAGLYAHFKAINDAVDIPILIYNIPPRSVIDMSVETMTELSKLKNIIGVKDATADLSRVSSQRLAMGPDFNQLSGEDATALGYMAHGGHGCISVAANVAPKLCAQFQSACMQGNFDAALELQDKLMPLHTALFLEASPAPAKYALEKLGMCGPMSSKSGGAKKRRGEDGKKIVADNRKARYDYSIDDVFEAGIVLRGTEVKALREGKASLGEAYAEVKDGEAFLVNAFIPEYLQANRFNHEPRRVRKLLLHAREIEKMGASVQRKGMTLIPLKIYFNDKGRVKIELGLAQGKRQADKRQTEKDRSWQRDKARLMREKG
ncbi:unnamed protein product [Effrenium voratum]|nr:unnamed protein product [Effrenium voratum]